MQSGILIRIEFGPEEEHSDYYSFVLPAANSTEAYRGLSAWLSKQAHYSSIYQNSAMLTEMLGYSINAILANKPRYGIKVNYQDNLWCKIKATPINVYID